MSETCCGEGVIVATERRGPTVGITNTGNSYDVFIYEYRRLVVEFNTPTKAFLLIAFFIEVALLGSCNFLIVDGLVNNSDWNVVSPASSNCTFRVSPSVSNDTVNRWPVGASVVLLDISYLIHTARMKQGEIPRELIDQNRMGILLTLSALTSWNRYKIYQCEGANALFPKYSTKLWFAFVLSIFLVLANGAVPRVWNCQRASMVANFGIHFLVPTVLWSMCISESGIWEFQLACFGYALMKCIYRGMYTCTLICCRDQDGLTTRDLYDYI